MDNADEDIWSGKYALTANGFYTVSRWNATTEKSVIIKSHYGHETTLATVPFFNSIILWWICPQFFVGTL